MKIKKILPIVLAFALLQVSCFSVAAKQTNSVTYEEKINIEKQAEVLFEKMQEIVEDFYEKSVLKLEKACRDYMKLNMKNAKFLKKSEFKKKLKNKNNIKLFGELKIKSNIDGKNGTGLYTTTKEKEAKRFSKSSDIAEMFINKKDVKIIDIKTLKQIKNEIIEKLKSEEEDAYSRFVGSNRRDFINKVNPLKKFFEDAEAFCWYNEAFLAWLLGYDVLKNGDEYVIVNLEILNILKK